jgi:protein phosphatase 1G
MENSSGPGLDSRPGYDSGCTAVVALLQNEKNLYVANAGDSRCVVCRSGKAIEMSEDHKPEDEIERERIEKAGGQVTKDGRVNSGLNLSRAIGDHSYKQNKALPLSEQMITALPDIRKLDIDVEKDEFMVLACDGIWNFMSSQEVGFMKNFFQIFNKKMIYVMVNELCSKLKPVFKLI